MFFVAWRPFSLPRAIMGLKSIKAKEQKSTLKGKKVKE